MNIMDIICGCLIGALIIYIPVSCILSRVNAKKLGIIRAKYPANIKMFVCHAVCAALGIMLVITRVGECEKYGKILYGLQTRGVRQFYAEYYGIKVLDFDDPEEEEKALDKLIADYQEKYDKERRAAEWQAVVMLCFASAALFNGAYITKQGLIYFGEIKLKKTAAKIEDGKLRFYLEKNPDGTALTLPATEENLRLYSEFITEGKVQ